MSSEETPRRLLDDSDDPKDDPSARLPDETQIVVAAVAILLIGVFHYALPSNLTLFPSWLLIVAEILLLLPPLVGGVLLRRLPPYRISRAIALVLLLVMTTALVGSLALWVTDLITKQGLAGREVLRSGAILWIINILVFAAWFWEIDGGGPLKRVRTEPQATDLLFPQYQNNNPTKWSPGYIDYIFFAFNSSTALSPADTSPLSKRAKIIMMAQATISLVIIVLIVGRSVNIL